MSLLTPAAVGRIEGAPCQSALLNGFAMSRFLPCWAMLSASRCSCVCRQSLRVRVMAAMAARWSGGIREESGDCNLGTLEPEACGYVIECASGVVIGVDSGVV